MKTVKKASRGDYMKFMDKQKASKIMAQRALNRWSKTTKAQRVTIAHGLVKARRDKKSASKLSK